MAGMYPDNETLELFGETISWPGVDENGKFTNGSFSNPAVRPSFIPAETINLILDNISGLLTALGKTPNNKSSNQLSSAILNAFERINYPIGKRYTQYPNDPDPMEAGLPGNWEVWNSRAEEYGLSSQPLPPYVVYTPTANYAADAYVLYHLSGDDYALFKAKAAVADVAVQLDPVLWDKVQPDVFIPRRRLQEWLDSDFEIGDQIEGGDYDGFYVAEINVLGGKFPSFSGGNRPPFISGGVAGDAIRNFTGFVGGIRDVGSADGRLFYKNYSHYDIAPGQGANGPFVYFDPSRVVPVAAENQVRTISKLIWCRVA